MKRAIIIMAKVPIAGKVKTRLHPFLSPEDCAGLATAFLQDSVSKAENICKNVILAYSPPEEINALRKFLPSQSIYIEQKGRDLGERMFNAFEFAFHQKTYSIVMIGTDSPTFPAEYIELAFEFLETGSEMILGKSEDGGFYLIGLRVLRGEIFENIAWSSPETFGQVYRKACEIGLHLRETPQWFDVDEERDLLKLQKEISQNINAQRRAPQTFEWVKANLKDF